MNLKMLGMVLSVLLLIPVGLLASGRNSKKIDIVRVVKVGSTSLKPGHYKVTWTGSGNDVQVIFLHDNKTIAVAPAHVVWRNNPYDDAVETKTSPDNSQVVQELDWRKVSLVFEATDSSGQLTRIEATRSAGRRYRAFVGRDYSVLPIAFGMHKDRRNVRLLPAIQATATLFHRQTEPDALWQISSFTLNTSTFLLRIRRKNNPDVTVLGRNCGSARCRLQQYPAPRTGRMMIAEDSEAAWLKPVNPDR